MNIPRPPHKMKTVIKLIDRCLDDEQECGDCPYIRNSDCQRMLLKETAYYLKMTLEKSGKGQKNE